MGSSVCAAILLLISLACCCATDTPVKRGDSPVTVHEDEPTPPNEDEDKGKSLSADQQKKLGRVLLGSVIGSSMGFIGGETTMAISGGSPEPAQRLGHLWAGMIGGAMAALSMPDTKGANGVKDQYESTPYNERMQTAVRGMENGMVGGAIGGTLTGVGGSSSGEDGSSASSASSSSSSGDAGEDKAAEPNDPDTMAAISVKAPLLHNAVAGGLGGLAAGYFEPEIIVLAGKVGEAAEKAVRLAKAAKKAVVGAGGKLKDKFKKKDTRTPEEKTADRLAEEERAKLKSSPEEMAEHMKDNEVIVRLTQKRKTALTEYEGVKRVNPLHNKGQKTLGNYNGVYPPKGMLHDVHTKSAYDEAIAAVAEEIAPKNRLLQKTIENVLREPVSNPADKDIDCKSAKEPSDVKHARNKDTEESACSLYNLLFLSKPLDDDEFDEYFCLNHVRDGCGEVEPDEHDGPDLRDSLGDFAPAKNYMIHVAARINNEIPLKQRPGDPFKRILAPLHRQAEALKSCRDECMVESPPEDTECKCAGWQ